MIDLVIQLSLVLLVLAILLALVRMVKGPTVLDRILAFDTITVCVVGLIILLSIQWETPHFLELILVVSLLGFVSGVAFVVYLERAMDPTPPGADAPHSADAPKPPHAGSPSKP